MMTPSTLSSRLNALSEAHKTTIILIARLSRLPIQPGSSPLSDDGNDARVELSSEIHQGLKEQEEALELLKQEVEDYVEGARGPEREKERAKLEASVARTADDLKLARAQFRKAQLQAKRNAELSRQKERDLLFGGARSSSVNERRRGQEKLSQDELLVNASGDVTAALRRTHQLMQSELSKSQFAHETLQESTAALATLSDNYSSLDGLLSSSRNLLGTLLRTQKSDTWYLETAFYILVATIAWLFFRRILYGPMWWFIWLPLKLLFRTSSSITRYASNNLRSGTSLPLTETMVAGATVMTTLRSADGLRPTFRPGQGISIQVGGGGRGAPGPGGYPSPSPPPPAESERPATEQVEKIIDESQQQEHGEQQESGEGASHGAENAQENTQQRNPKKRMWEEDVEARKEAERQRDEL